jgi:hypothetical protein
MPGAARIRRRLALPLVVGLLTSVLLAEAVRAEPTPTWSPDPAAYGVAERTDVPITMDDGRVLRAVVHDPTDPTTGLREPGPFPVIVWLTPYGKSVTAPIDDALVRRGYIGVAVDVAGTGGSEGASQLFGPVEAGDSKEVVQWAADGGRGWPRLAPAGHLPHRRGGGSRTGTCSPAAGSSTSSRRSGSSPPTPGPAP